MNINLKLEKIREAISFHKEIIEKHEKDIIDSKEIVEKYEKDIRDLENEVEFPYFLRKYVDRYSEMMKNREDHIPNSVIERGYQYTMENLIKEPRCTGRSTRIVLEMFRDILYKGVKNPIFIANTLYVSRDMVSTTANNWLNHEDLRKLDEITSFNINNLCKSRDWLQGCSIGSREEFTVYFDHHLDSTTEEWIMHYKSGMRYNHNIKQIVLG